MDPQKIAGLNQKSTKVISTGKLLKIIDFENWTTSEAEPIPEDQVEIISTHEKIYEEGVLTRESFYVLFWDNENIIKRTSNEIIYDSSGRAEYEVFYVYAEDMVIVKNIVEGEYVGKSLFKIDDSGTILSASHYYYLGTTTKYWFYKTVVDEKTGEQRTFLETIQGIKKYVRSIVEQDDIDDLLLFREDSYTFNNLKKYVKYSYEVGSVNGEDNYVINGTQTYAIQQDEETGEIKEIIESEIEYGLTEMDSLDGICKPKYFIALQAVIDYSDRDDFSLKTISYPSTTMKIASEASYEYVGEEKYLVYVVEYWVLSIAEILNKNSTAEHNIYNFFSDENMIAFMENVIDDNLLLAFSSYLRDNPAEILEKCLADSRFYFLEDNDDYQSAVSNSMDELFALHEIAFDPIVGISKHDISYDDGQIEQERWFDVHGDINEVVNFEWTDDVTFTKTLADGVGNIKYSSVVAKNHVLSGKIYTYDNDMNLKQIDHYESGALKIVEGYVYEEVDGLKQKSRIIMYDKVKGEISRIYEFDDSGNQYGSKKITYSGTNAIEVIIYDNNNVRTEKIVYDYPGTEPRIVLNEYYSEEAPTKKTEYFYTDSASYTLKRTVDFLYETITSFSERQIEGANFRWVIQSEKYYNSDGEVITERNLVSNVETSYGYD